MNEPRNVNWIFALLMSVFFGTLGVDRFILGHIGLGLLKLITFGGFGVWWLIDVILIATSASVFDKNQQASLAVGCNAFLPKPIQIDTLFESLQHYLGLEWIYEGTTAPKINLEETLTASPMVIPPQEEVTTLFNLTMMGDIQAIQQQVEKLEHLNESLGPFAAQIRHFAKGFQIKKICEFLEPHLKKGAN